MLNNISRDRIDSNSACQYRTERLVPSKFLSKVAGTIVGALKERIRYRGKSSGAINNHVPE